LEATNVTMKIILSLIIGGALVVSGFGQTRNVLVGTNSAVVQPTNFWSADAVNARSGLGLGSAATNPASAFQPSSLNLSNVSANNGGGLTNLNATNVIGTLGVAQGGTGATNASDARTALGLGTAATNPATAFQPSSLVLSNLSSNNGSSLTNIPVSGVVGALATDGSALGLTNFPASILTITGSANGLTNFPSIVLQTNTAETNFPAFILRTNGNASGLTNFPSSVLTSGSSVTNFPSGLLRTNGSAENLTNFPSLLLRTNGNAASLTNVQASSVVGTVALASNITGFVTIARGGTSATNAADARQNLGSTVVGDAVFVATNPAAARTALALGTAATSATTDFQPANANLTNLAANNAINLTNFPTIGLASNVSGVVAITNGGSGATTAGGARTNLGLTWTGLTNPSASTFQTALFGANTNPVLVDANGEVVSPTNFWQVAPISTTVQYQTNIVTTSTNNATNSRNLYLFSLASSVSGVTNTVALPTNPATTFEGDKATITHLAQTTNSATAIRQLGASTNLITINQLDETVALIYRGGQWRLAENISYIEPIYFSGTNAAANAAASVTNLFTPNTPLVYNTNGEVVANTGTNVLTFTNEEVYFREYFSIQEGLLKWEGKPRISIEEMNLSDNSENIRLSWGNNTNGVDVDLLRTKGPIEFTGGEAATNAAETRTNLGIPLAALTNTSNVTFQSAVFTTNAAPTNTANVNSVGFNTAVKWMEVTLNISGTNQVFRIPLFQ
jgi:hypothetical protein